MFSTSVPAPAHCDDDIPLTDFLILRSICEFLIAAHCKGSKDADVIMPGSTSYVRRQAEWFATSTQVNDEEVCMSHVRSLSFRFTLRDSMFQGRSFEAVAERTQRGWNVVPKEKGALQSYLGDVVSNEYVSYESPTMLLDWLREDVVAPRLTAIDYAPEDQDPEKTTEVITAAMDNQDEASGCQLLM